MKKLIPAAAAVMLIASGAWAADDAAKTAPAAEPTGQHHEWTLEDARKHAHAYADKLDKMTPEQWAEKRKKHKEWHDKWKAMTPEEKEAAKKMRAAKRHHQEQDSAAPASEPAAKP